MPAPDPRNGFRVVAPDDIAAGGAAGASFGVDQPHYHLNTIGNPKCVGVTLTTEDPANLPLYEHFGYKVIGHVRVSADVETWGFLRPDDPA